MSYDVAIHANGMTSGEIFDWLEEQHLYHIQDWSYTSPDYFKDDWTYTFKFKRREDATIFALRWS
jgi:hypothetical protein